MLTQFSSASCMKQSTTRGEVLSLAKNRKCRRYCTVRYSIKPVMKQE